jgi:hypothetical protein
VCVICQRSKKGQVEQFLRKFRDGMRHDRDKVQPFENGFVRRAKRDATLEPGQGRVGVAACPNAYILQPDYAHVLTYFSFVTLTTVGYGDISPVSAATRTLSWMEAITGQFYLAVIVAGLVGLLAAKGKRGSMP